MTYRRARIHAREELLDGMSGFPAWRRDAGPANVDADGYPNHVAPPQSLEEFALATKHAAGTRLRVASATALQLDFNSPNGTSPVMAAFWMIATFVDVGEASGRMNASKRAMIPG